jgi:hypothetical protein
MTPDAPSLAAPETAQAALARRIAQQARALADAEDWDAVVALGLRTGPAALLSESIGLFLAAALRRNDAAVLDRLVQHAALADVEPRQRSALANRLATGGWPLLAWHLLLSDPATLTTPEAGEMTAGALFRIAHESRLLAERDPGWALLRNASVAAYRRLVNKAPDRRHFTPYPFPAAERDPAVLRRRHPISVLRAQGVAEAAADPWHAALVKVDQRFAEAPAPQVHAWHDVFVNRLGQIWDGEGRAVFSRRGPIPPRSLAAMADAPRLEEAALAVGTGDQNFGHWHCEWLAGLAWRLAAPEGAPARAVPLLVRDDALAFVSQALLLAGEAMPPARVGDATFVRRLYHTDMTLDGWAWRGLFSQFYARLAAAALAAAPPGPGPRLYLTRRDASRRPMANETELEAALAAEGFATVALGGLDLAAQIRTIAEAQVIVAPSGAALSHLILAPEHVVVFELMPLVAADIMPRLFFARLTQIRQQRHTLWLERADPDTQAWRVDIPGVLAALRPMLGGAGC